MTNAADGEDVGTVVVDGRVLMQGRQVLVVSEAEAMDEAQEAMDQGGKVVGWRVPLTETRPVRTPIYWRVSPTARSMRWAARLGWQAVRERVRPPGRQE